MMGETTIQASTWTRSLATPSPAFCGRTNSLKALLGLQDPLGSPMALMGLRALGSILVTSVSSTPSTTISRLILDPGWSIPAGKPSSATSSSLSTESRMSRVPEVRSSYVLTSNCAFVARHSNSIRHSSPTPRNASLLTAKNLTNGYHF